MARIKVDFSVPPVPAKLLWRNGFGKPPKKTLTPEDKQKLHDFVTVNMDMIAHYRSGENVVRRPPMVGGAGYNLIGRHEIMVPLLAHAVVEGLARV